MEELFFNTTYSNPQQTLLTALAFLAITIFALWVIYFILSKVMFKKSNSPKEINLKLVFLWSLFTYFLLFNVYLYFLLYRNGIDWLNWKSIKFYLGIITQLTIYIGILAFFFVKRHSIIKLINEKAN